MMKLLVPILTLALLGFTAVYAYEPIPITVSNTMDRIVFDGKWTFEYEWKASSLNTYSYDDGTSIILRSAHQGDFIYIFLDPITDHHLNTMNDHAIICFDAKNNKSTNADFDDYCFMTSLGGRSGFAYQGGHYSTKNDLFGKIRNPEGFVAVSTASDANDRYTSIPHPSYEFQIPTDLLGRESVYGFHFVVYDAHTKKIYTYPQNLDVENFVSSPSQWGEIYSPDSSLPEFGIPMIILFISIMSIVFFFQIKRGSSLQLR